MKLICELKGWEYERLSKKYLMKTLKETNSSFVLSYKRAQEEIRLIHKYEESNPGKIYDKPKRATLTLTYEIDK